MSLPGFTWQCGLKYTDIKLQTLQDKEVILSLENKIRAGTGAKVGERYVNSDENEKKIVY